MDIKDIQEKVKVFLTEDKKTILNVCNTLSKKYNIKVLYLRLIFMVTVFYGVGAYIILYILIEKKLLMFSDDSQPEITYNNKITHENRNTQNNSAEIKANSEIKESINHLKLNNMAYKVVRFDHTTNVAGGLQQIIDSEAVGGYKYVNHEYSDKLNPGKAGCFGFGAEPDTTIHVGFVVFEKKD